jgi:hypothetical protein
MNVAQEMMWRFFNLKLFRQQMFHLEIVGGGVGHNEVDFGKESGRCNSTNCRQEGEDRQLEKRDVIALDVNLILNSFHLDTYYFTKTSCPNLLSPCHLQQVF